MTNVVNSMIIILFYYVLKVHLSLFLPNGNIGLIAQTVVCLIYTNVGLVHAIVYVISRLCDFRRFQLDELPQGSSDAQG